MDFFEDGPRPPPFNEPVGEKANATKMPEVKEEPAENGDPMDCLFEEGKLTQPIKNVEVTHACARTTSSHILPTGQVEDPSGISSSERCLQVFFICH